jgi:hypothetical protein
LRIGIVTQPRLGVTHMQLETLRLGPLKIGTRVVELRGRIRPHLASSHPDESLWRALVAHRDGS